MTLPTDASPRPVRALHRPLLAVAFVLAVIAGVLGSATAAWAASPAPSLGLTTTATPTVLHAIGETEVRLTATNQGGATAHNLSYRLVVPGGMSVAPGGAGAPSVTLAGKPLAGNATLIWRAVADLPAGASHTLTVRLAHNPASFNYNTPTPIQGGAYATGDAAVRPAFGAVDGQPQLAADPANPTGWATANTTSTLTGLLLEKTEDSAGGLMLRGAHDQQRVHTLTIHNNGSASTTNLQLDDYLPAGVEFLGCSGADHTQNAGGTAGQTEETPGSGSLAATALASCLEPAIVETVNLTGHASVPDGLYTHVRWTAAQLSSLTPGQSRSVRYRAAIPRRANTLTWPAGTPATTGGLQAANLDNNSGAPVAAGTVLTSHSTVTGYYAGQSSRRAEGTLAFTRTAANVRLSAEPLSGTLRPGDEHQWTLRVAAAEYASARDAELTVTLPDGLCPLQAGANLADPGGADPQDAECAEAPGGLAPSVPYTTSAENPDGSWTLTFAKTTWAQLALVASGDALELAVPIRVRAHRQEAGADAGALRSGDAVTLQAALSATDDDTAAPLTSEVSAQLSAALPTLRKQVATSGADCSAASFVDSHTLAGAPIYHPGDRVCWLLDASFPGGVATDGGEVIDWLPDGASRDLSFGLSTGEAPLAADTGFVFDSAAADLFGPGGRMTWTPPAGLDGDARFLRHVATRAAAPLLGGAPVLHENAARIATVDSAGTQAVARDTAGYTVHTPLLAISGRITGRDATVFPTPLTSTTIRGGDEMTVRLTVTNSGLATATNAEVWTRLPAGHDCADATPIGGSCADGLLRWTLPSVPVGAGAAVAVEYRFVPRASIEPGQQLVPQSGIRRYATPVNTGGEFHYLPINNIDPAIPAPDATSTAAPEARTSTTMTALSPSLRIERTTQLNAAATEDGEATIGERITYRVIMTVPRGTTVRGAAITSTVPARQTYVAGSLAWSGGDAAGHGELSVSGTTLRAALPASYTAPGGQGVADTELSADFTVTAADDAASYRGSGVPATLSTTATLSHLNAAGTTINVSGGTITTRIVEPSLTITHTAQASRDGTAIAEVAGGDLVDYAVTLGTAAGTAPAYDTTLQVTLPVGVTPLTAGGMPLGASGETASGGSWDAGTRTITFSPPATIQPGPTGVQSYAYAALVDDPPIGGRVLTSAAAATTTSMPGIVAGERSALSTARTVGYTASASATVSAQTATIARTADKTSATIGERVTYTSTVRLPAHVAFYDTTVRDVLPGSLAVDGFDDAETRCTEPDPCDVTVRRYDATTAAGATTLAWDLGDIEAAADERVVTIVYTVRVRTTSAANGANVVGGGTAPTSATVGSNRTSKHGAFDAAVPPTGAFDDSASASRALAFTEPVVQLSKEVKVGAGAWVSASTMIRPGDALRYRLTVMNSGTSPLHDVELRDVAPPQLTNVAAAAVTPSGAAVVSDDWTVADPAMGWTLTGPIAPGSSVTIEYTAELISILSLRDGESVTAGAQVTAGYGLATARRPAPPSPTPATDYYRVYGSALRATPVVVDTPNPTVRKYAGAAGTDTTAPAQIRQEVTFRVVVGNADYSSSLTGITVRDVLPRDWEYIAGSGVLSFSAGTGVGAGAAEPQISDDGNDATGPVLTWNQATQLSLSGSATFTYRARPTLASATSIGSGAANPHINTAAATVLDPYGNAADADGAFPARGPAAGTFAATASATLSVPVLTIESGAGAATVHAGNTGSYVVTLTNTGAAPAHDIVVTSALPAGVTYTPGAAAAVPSTGVAETSATATAIEWTIATIGAGQKVAITVPVRTAANLPAGTVLAQTATAGSSTTTGTVSAASSLTTTTSADASITASGPASAGAGGPLSVTLTAASAGPSLARDVRVTIPVPAGTSFTSASFPGRDEECAVSGGVVTCELGDVAPGAAPAGSVVFAVSQAATGSVAVAPAITTSTPDPVAVNDAASLSISIVRSADLSLAAAAAKTSLARGEQTTLTLTAANDGPSDASGVQLALTLPAGLEHVSDDAGCTLAATTLSCTLGAITVGGEQEVGVVVRATAPGDHAISAGVSASAPMTDPDTANNGASVDFTVAPGADLRAALSAPAGVAAGGALTLTATASNHGPDAATSVAVTFEKESTMGFMSASPGCISSITWVRCMIPTLASGADATRTVTLRVPVALGASVVTSSVRVSGDQADAVAANDVATATTQVGPASNLVIEHGAPASAAAGGELTWPVRVRNLGPSTAHHVTLAHVLPAGVEFVDAAADQGSCSHAAGTVACELGTIAVDPAGRRGRAGASGWVAVNIRGRIPASFVGQTLTASLAVTADEPDPEPATRSAVGTTVVGAPAPPTPPAPGGGEPGNGESTVGGPPADAGAAAGGGGKGADGSGSGSGSAGGRDADDLGGADALPPTTLKLTVKQPRKKARGGDRLTATVTVRNTGKRTAHDVIVCDRLPNQLTYRSKRGGELLGGELCFSIRTLAPKKSRIYKLKVRVNPRSGRGTVKLRVTASAANANEKRARASFKVTTTGKIRPELVRGFTG